jgi:hypothetical protein
VLGAICEWRNPRQMRWCAAIAAAVVSALVVGYFPEITMYRGLSGIDTALFALLAIELIHDARRDSNRILASAAALLLAGFALKTGYEALTRQTLFVDEQAAGFVPLVWDHVAAGFVGLCAATFPWRAAAQAECQLSPS